MNKVVNLDNLDEKLYGNVICYPFFEKKDFIQRCSEMKKIGIKEIYFEGEQTINKIEVIGKGCTSIVLSVLTKDKKVALKIRRTDSDRLDMRHEAFMLQLVNSVNVGPKFLSYSKNLLLMELIDGAFLPSWIYAIDDQTDVRHRICNVLKDTLEQCWILDQLGLDHGELSHAPKHILITSDDKVTILDFESSSMARKVSNLTSICNYFFISGNVSKAITKILGCIKKEKLILALRKYKRTISRRDFKKILDICLISDI
jgi:putative serine/threonine protein kinase